jgi:hypothetical protein
VETRADLEQMLAEGQWLSPGQVAVLLGGSRWTVIRATEYGWKVGSEVFPLRADETAGGHRRCNPEDVRRIMEAKAAHRVTQDVLREQRVAAREQQRAERQERAAAKRRGSSPETEEARRRIQAKLDAGEISADEAAEALRRLEPSAPPPRAGEA